MSRPRQFIKRVNHPVNLGDRNMTDIEQSRFGVRKLIRKLKSQGFFNKAKHLEKIDQDLETVMSLV